jgi:hypothetical protein
MAKINEPKKVLPFAGLIFEERCVVEEVLRTLEPEAGNIVLKSDVIPFDYTTYYNKEIGNRLLRQWCVFGKLIMPNFLVDLKRRTNHIEQKYLNEHNGRRINIDPGLVSLSNLILASTKNYAHRIYLGKGIYGEVTLIYKDKAYIALEWTYPDYREPIAIKFFEKAREILKEKLKYFPSYSSPLKGEDNGGGEGIK